MITFFFFTGLRLLVKGKENFLPGQNYIVVFNHNSLIDVPVSVPFMPGANKTIAKVELARIPVFGLLYKRGSVLVDRKNDESRKMSYIKMKEVLDMLVEENYKENYGDIDPNSPEFIALALLKTKQFFKRSATLAGFVENEFTKAGRTSSGQQQRQVGIWVLQATAMPSVLVETGFITNREEEDYLNTKEGQQEISKCVTDAVKNYIGWLEKQQQPLNSSTQNTNGTPNPVKDSRAFLDLIERKENNSF